MAIDSATAAFGDYTSCEREGVPAERVIPIPDRAVFEIGDEVLALWDDRLMDRARIIAISTDSCTVEWSDGSGEQLMTLGTLTFWSWTRA